MISLQLLVDMIADGMQIGRLALPFAPVAVTGRPCESKIKFGAAFDVPSDDFAGHVSDSDWGMAPT